MVVYIKFLDLKYILNTKKEALIIIYYRHNKCEDKHYTEVDFLAEVAES